MEGRDHGQRRAGGNALIACEQTAIEESYNDAAGQMSVSCIQAYFLNLSGFVFRRLCTKLLLFSVPARASAENLQL